MTSEVSDNNPTARQRAIQKFMEATENMPVVVLDTEEKIKEWFAEEY